MTGKQSRLQTMPFQSVAKILRHQNLLRQSKIWSHTEWFGYMATLRRQPKLKTN